MIDDNKGSDKEQLEFSNLDKMNKDMASSETVYIDRLNVSGRKRYPVRSEMWEESHRLGIIITDYLVGINW